MLGGLGAQQAARARDWVTVGDPLQARSVCDSVLAMPNDESMKMARIQETEYGEGRDYTYGSPHLTHAWIRERIENDLTELVREIVEAKGSCRAVEIGAGHGTFTGAILRGGATVAITEMSAPSVAVLEQKYAANGAVTVVYDPEATEASRVADGCDLVVFVSVLHHIPDYISAVESLTEQIAPGGAFYCAQDPTWYPRRSRRSMVADRGAYMLWRLGQGNIKRGLATRARRMRGVYDESAPADMVEYHVVRNGVDEQALEGLLRDRFAEVDTWLYWSTQARLLQRLGDRLKWRSTFGIVARRRLPAGGQ